jgi:kumamolisin
MGQATTNAANAATPSTVSVGDELALTFYMQPKNLLVAEIQAIAMQTPGSPNYHKFLTVNQFVKNYAPSDADIATATARLQKLGFTVTYVYPNHLAIEAVATAGTTQNALGVSLKRYTLHGRTGMAPSAPVTLPATLSGLFRGVGGMDTITHAHPRHAIPAFGHSPTPSAMPAKLTGGVPGYYLPSDFVSFYDVAPIYNRGLTGRGSTIGIVTLNDFDPADAFLFWKQIGLSVSKKRITKVDVDGGVETVGTNDGEGETDLDVEESGALAPDADVRVYIAPNNTNANFINAFEAAASENIADTVSTSWGQPELEFFYNLATGTPGDTWELQAFHDAFLEMALQGQTLYVAAGDSGSYDTTSICSPFGTPTADAPVCNYPYAIDHPSSDPLVTAAGGTTRPFVITLTDGLKILVPTEQAWGWDYLSNQAAAQGKPDDIPVSDVFSVGGGGGVSSYWTLPLYQLFTRGITLSKPGQLFIENAGTGKQVQNVLLPYYFGRNTPDISTNADPESGYQFVQDGGLNTYYGGTSFVAPQLNGVTALFVQGLGHRVGQINPALYDLGKLATTDIVAGDNWGYAGKSGYDNASGLGVLDAAKLLDALIQR